MTTDTDPTPLPTGLDLDRPLLCTADLMAALWGETEGTRMRLRNGERAGLYRTAPDAPRLRAQGKPRLAYSLREGAVALASIAISRTTGHELPFAVELARLMDGTGYFAAIYADGPDAPLAEHVCLFTFTPAGETGPVPGDDAADDPDACVLGCEFLPARVAGLRFLDPRLSGTIFAAGWRLPHRLARLARRAAVNAAFVDAGEVL